VAHAASKARAQDHSGGPDDLIGLLIGRRYGRCSRHFQE
jgi:hypothetical protein